MIDVPKPDYLKAYFTAQPPKEGLPKRFGIVTAFNAGGQTLAAEVNRAADDKLRQHLREAGLECFRVTGGSRDGTHSEQGFGITAESPDHIRAISKRFGQEAFFWVEGGVLFVANTDGAKLHRVDLWLHRQRQPRKGV